MSVAHRLDPVRGRRLVESDLDRVSALIDTDPLVNIQLGERVGQSGLRDVPFFGLEHDSELLAVATIAPSLHAAVSPGLREREAVECARLIADELFRAAVPLRAIIAPAVLVDPLWTALEGLVPSPPVDRRRQPVYALYDPAPAELRKVSMGTLDDLERLVPACAAMYLEEVGIDPLRRDARWYGERIRDLVVAGRSFVMKREGEIVFKCEIAAETDDAAQLMGVWTRPDLRRQGLAREGLGEVLGHLGTRGRDVTLFVNDFNRAAISLYESLGFQPIGSNRALIW